jgi:hypothetical protein
MSAPISARMHSAPRDWMPTTVHSSSTADAKGAQLLLDRVRESVDLLVEDVDVRKDMRPGTCLTCRALTSRHSKSSSRIARGAFQ